MSVEERYRRELSRYRIYRVAAAEKEILGFTWNEITDDEDSDCEIIALYVRYGKRKSGIGRALFRDSVEIFRAAGRKNMIIWCLRDNAEARKFYPKFRIILMCKHDYCHFAVVEILRYLGKTA